MNIENIVFNNIQKIDFFPDLIDSKIVNRMKIELIRQNKSDANYFKIYFSKLMKKYNNDNDLICKHIFNVFLSKYHATKIDEEVVNEDVADILSMTIQGTSSKSISVYFPIKYNNSNNDEILKLFKETTLYYTFKEKAVNTMENDILKIYSVKEIDNIIMFDSPFRTSFQLYKEKKEKNNESLYFFTKEMKTKKDSDTIVKISKDFLNKNSNNIDQYFFDDQKIKITFNNGKIFEVSNKDLIEALTETLNSLQDKLIDIKTKKLYKRK